MKLLIHDLNESQWEKVAMDYQGWEVISDDGKIKPCIGCFGCWTKTPGECVIRDGYERMGALIHKAEEVVVISEYTYGGLSPFVKNVFDRSISFVLPFFEIINGEMHHKSRYPEQKPITFIFRGNGLSDNDKKLARSYVKAVCTNLHGIIKDIKFEEYDPALTSEMEQTKRIDDAEETQGTILLNCSLRADAANSKKMLDALSSKITGDKESVNLSSFINNMDELVTRLKGAEKIVFGTPLYVDGIPSALLRLMCKMEQDPGAKNKIIYAVTNMGFYESSQQKHLVAMIKRWCLKCGYKYGGAVAVGAGEMVGMMVNTPAAEKGPAKNAAQALQSMGEAVNSSSSMENIYANAAMFPRFMYMFAANSGWPRSGKQNGLKKKDLFKQIDLS